MKEDRRAMPSYLYEPSPLPPAPKRRSLKPSMTLLVVWGFIALAAAFEIYAAIKLSPGFEQ